MESSPLYNGPCKVAMGSEGARTPLLHGGGGALTFSFGAPGPGQSGDHSTAVHVPQGPLHPGAKDKHAGSLVYCWPIALGWLGSTALQQ